MIKRRTLKSGRTVFTKKRSARVAPRTKRAIRKVVKTEIQKGADLKHQDIEVSGDAISNSGTFYNPTAIEPGDAFNQRDGLTIMPTSFEYSFAHILGDTTNFMRILIFRWLPNSSINPPTVAQLLADSTFPYLSPLSAPQRNQFNVLYDNTISLHASHPQQAIRFSKKLAAKKVLYDSGAGVTTGAGKIYILVISDSGAATHPSITGYFRLNYHD